MSPSLESQTHPSVPQNLPQSPCLIHPQWRAYVALVVVCIVWGTTLAAIHVGVQTIAPLQLACIRFIVAGSLLLSICRFKGEAFPSPSDLILHCVVGFLLFFAGHSFTYWALQHISTGLGAVLTATNPFWLLWLTSVLPPKEKIPPMAYLGLAIGFVGMLILLSPQWVQPQKISGLFWASVVGVLLMAFFWCLGSIVVRKRPANTSLLMGLSIQHLFAGLLLIPVCYLFGGFQWHPSQASLVALAYLVLVGSMVAMNCYLYVLQTLPVPVVSTIAYVTTVITIVFGWFFLHETVTPMMALGSVIILAGVGLVQSTRHRSRGITSRVSTQK